MDQEPQTCAWRNLRFDLWRMPGCCYVPLSAKAEQKSRFTPNLRETLFPFRCIIILPTFSCFQFHLLLPIRPFSLKLGPIIKLWASVPLQTHAYSFSTACQKTFGPQESSVRIHSESYNSFIAGYHLWLHSKPLLECQLICQYEFKSTNSSERLSFLFPCFYTILSHSDRPLNISLLRRIQSLYAK